MVNLTETNVCIILTGYTSKTPELIDYGTNFETILFQNMWNLLSLEKQTNSTKF